VPLVLLIATLPVYMEGELEAILGLQPTIPYIRARTARPKTRYTVKADIDNGKLRETTVRVVSKITSRLRAREKVIVYCKTIAECKAMAEQLECGQFYAGYVDKDESLQHWLDNGGCIVSSTALGTRVNYDNIVWVIYMGIPYGLIDFV